MMDARLVVRWSGGEAAFQAGTVVTLGRGVDMDIRCASTAVSRQHASVEHVDGVWKLRDLGSSQGTWRDGNQVSTVEIRGTVQVTLGRDGNGEVVVLESAAVSSAPEGTNRPGGAGLVVGAGDPTDLTGAKGRGPAGGTDSADGGGRAAGTVIVGPEGGANRPGGALLGEPRSDATVVTSSTVTVVCEGKVSTHQAGTEVTIGRDAGNQIKPSTPGVSRRHARLVHDGTSWLVEDLGSSGGTHVAGERISRFVLTGPTEVGLGDPVGGTTISVTPDGDPATGAAQGGGEADHLPAGEPKRNRRGLAVAGAAGALALLVVAVGLLASRGGGAGDGTSTEDLTRATVLVRSVDRQGSGTVIDAEKGLILTNAHLVAPSTPGRAASVAVMGDSIAPNPKELVIEVSAAADEEVEPRFLAEVVAADGYLDLAVLRITKTYGGRLVEPGSSDFDSLVAVEIGDSDRLTIGTDIRVLGFPGASHSRAVTLTQGAVSSAVQDERIGSSRAMLNIDADVLPGNSGGGAFDVDGRLVGVPTLLRGGEVSSMRPISFATDLIAAAQADEEYESPHYRILSSEVVSDVRLTSPGTTEGISFSCTGEQGRVANGAVGVELDFSGFVEGEHQDLLVEVEHRRKVVGSWSLDWDHPVEFPRASGCATVTVPIELPEDVIGKDVTLVVEVGVGPSHDPVP